MAGGFAWVSYQAIQAARIWLVCSSFREFTNWLNSFMGILRICSLTVTEPPFVALLLKLQLVGFLFGYLAPFGLCAVLVGAPWVLVGPVRYYIVISVYVAL